MTPSQLELRRARVGAWVGLTFGTLLAGALWLELGRRAELLFVDWRYHLDPRAQGVSPDIVVVEIDDSTISNMESLRQVQWPFTRDVWADFVNTLSLLGPKAIVMDVAFSDRRESARPDYFTSPFLRSAGSEGSRWLGTSAYAAGSVVIGVFEKSFPPGEGADRIQETVGRAPALVPYFKARLVPVGGRGVPPVYAPDAAGQVPALFFPEANVLVGARGVGMVNRTNVIDPDTALRRFAPVVEIAGERVVALCVAGYATAIANPSVVPAWPDNEPPPPVTRPPLPTLELEGASARIGSRTIPLRADGSAWIRWRGSWETDPYLRKHLVNAWQIFEAETAIALGKPAGTKWDPQSLRGKVVLVGYTAQGEAGDRTATPFGDQPGVYMHAAALDTILTGDFLKSVPLWLESSLVIALSMACGALILGLRPFNWQAAGQIGVVLSLLLPGIVLILAYWAGAMLAFRFGWIVNVFHVETSMLLTTVGSVGFGWLFIRKEAAEEARKREHMYGLLKRTFSADVVNDLIERSGGGEVPLGGKMYNLTVYFSDISGFTTIAERLQPEELVGILNEYLTRVTELFINKHRAHVDKYIGDAVMAFWGAPIPTEDGPVRACLAAIDAIDAMDGFSAELVKRGLPPLKTRIGVNTGPAVAAWIGHPEHIAFTALGDTVNLASRLEGANKAYGTTAMIGPETYEGAKAHILARELDLVKVKGKRIPVRVYELLGRADDPLPEAREVKRRYEAALALMRAREFERARQQFVALAKELGDPPSKTLTGSCEDFLRTPPPADWDGSNELHEK